jgi:drug/metabolite transporter (DMT)-like permease
MNRDKTQIRDSSDRFLRNPGVISAIGAALLFGSGTPLAKWLLTRISPRLLAGLLHLGSGLGLTAYRLLRGSPRVKLSVRECLWLAGAIVAGGIIGPVLLMFGLTNMPASGIKLIETTDFANKF